MLYSLILVVHLIACFILIAVILLQAGRGGGLSDMGGGGAAQSILGTRGATILTRATTACAVIFMLTSLSLAALSAQRGRSLMENVRPKAAAPEKAAAPATAPATAPVAEQPAPAEQPAQQP